MSTNKTPDAVYFTTVKSALESADGKYTGSIVHKGSSDLDEVVSLICSTRPYIDEPTVKMVIAALAAEIRREVGVNFRYVTTGTSTAFAPAISGSVPAMDSALEAGVNDIYVNITTLDKLRKAIAALVPVRADEGPANVIVDKIEDVATGACGQISLGGDFVVTGYNISASHDGESLRLVDDEGVVLATATIKEEDGKGQRITAAFDGALEIEAGKYWLHLVSRGYSTPLEELVTYARRVVLA